MRRRNTPKFNSKGIARTFHVSLAEIEKIISNFHSEMEKGIRGEKSSLKMLPTYVKRPKGTEKGNFLAIDLGGTNLRVSALRLTGKRRIVSYLSERFPLRKKYVTTKGEALFDFIAKCIKNFMNKHKIDIMKRHNVGFTFSFPIKKESIASGILVRWTKGFRASGVEGKDVVKLLNTSLRRIHLSNTKIVAILNDTVSTLLARSYEDSHCDIGVILGTGTNACYCERKDIINIEWGNFNKLRLTPYDEKLDRLSENPGEQILEKMVSGMYLGRLTGLVLEELGMLKNGKNFKTEYLSAIEKGTLKREKPVKEICLAVSRRAERIAAAAIAAVITKMDPRLYRKHTVAIDGSLYEKHPGFSKNIRKTLREIFGERAKNITLKLTKDASGKGAAIVAAMA